MTSSHTRRPPGDRPSLWAVALLVASSSLALVSILLLYSGYGIA